MESPDGGKAGEGSKGARPFPRFRLYHPPECRAAGRAGHDPNPETNNAQNRARCCPAPGGGRGLRTGQGGGRPVRRTPRPAAGRLLGRGRLRGPLAAVVPPRRPTVVTQAAPAEEAAADQGVDLLAPPPLPLTWSRPADKPVNAAVPVTPAARKAVFYPPAAVTAMTPLPAAAAAARPTLQPLAPVAARVAAPRSWPTAFRMREAARPVGSPQNELRGTGFRDGVPAPTAGKPVSAEVLLRARRGRLRPGRGQGRGGNRGGRRGAGETAPAGRRRRAGDGEQNLGPAGNDRGERPPHARRGTVTRGDAETNPRPPLRARLAGRSAGGGFCFTRSHFGPVEFASLTRASASGCTSPGP